MNCIVLGMHRSGTSALTRCLNLMGLNVGDKTELLPENQHNPLGYWELKEVVRINDALLELEGKTWSSLEPLTYSPPPPPELTSRMKEVIQGLNQPWVLKDPRFCITLPYWKDSLRRTNVSFLGIVRNELDVAASLMERDEMDILEAKMLRNYYLETARRSTRGKRYLEIRFEDLLARPKQTLTSVQEFLQLSKVGLSLAQQSLTPNVVHWRS